MSQAKQNQRMINWLESEKRKDQRELELQKKLLVQQITKINKKDIFPEPKKISLWQKLKVMILGT
jgi:hypothetical protein